MKRRKAVTSVPRAGSVLGLGRWAAYEAAKRGDIPTIRIGERLCVSVVWLEQTVGVVDGDLDEILEL